MGDLRKTFQVMRFGRHRMFNTLRGFHRMEHERLRNVELMTEDGRRNIEMNVVSVSDDGITDSNVQSDMR